MFLYGLDQGGGVLGPDDLPQQISKKPISGKSRSHLRQDAEDVQRNDFISQLFAKIEGTPKQT